MGYYCMAFCQLPDLAVVPATGDLLQLVEHHIEVGKVVAGKVPYWAVRTAACSVLHRDPYFGGRMGLWGGHTQVADRMGQLEADKEAGQTWKKAPCCLLHKGLLDQALLKRAHSFDLCTLNAIREHSEAGATSNALTASKVVTSLDSIEEL